MKLLAILATAIVLFTGAVFFLVLPMSAGSGRQVVFQVNPGESNKKIAENLKAEGLIRSELAFRAFALTMGAANNLQAGFYAFSPAESPVSLLQKLSSGEVITEKLVVPEGWSIRDIAFHLENRGMFQAEEFMEQAGFPAVDYRRAADLPPLPEYAADYRFLQSKPPYVGLEGYLFPDTYELKRDTTVPELIAKMLANFDRKYTDELRAEASRQGKTVFETVTMASLLEKEVRSYEDKRAVAGILEKRMANGVPLQVDATVTYVTGEGEGRNINTEVESAYNTYKYRGLPLGPIANPGLESIRAALNPAESEFWYYLSAPSGETIFSRTFQEHKAAKAQYLQ